MQTDKKQLRSILRQKRNDLSSHKKNNAAKAIREKVIALSVFQSSQHIAFYIAHDGEVDIEMLLRRTLEMEKACYLPILQTTIDHHLNFYSYHLENALIKNRFGIKEPNITQESLIAPVELDLIFLPLVAFDKKGNRLGRGAGYYDRTLAFLKNSPKKKPVLIGIAYEFQKINLIPVEKWDIPLNFVVTEENVYHF